MDILYLLIPLSVLLVLFILGGLWWAINRGQFDNIEQEGADSSRRLICINNAQSVIGDTE